MRYSCTISTLLLWGGYACLTLIQLNHYYMKGNTIVTSLIAVAVIVIIIIIIVTGKKNKSPEGTPVEGAPVTDVQNVPAPADQGVTPADVAPAQPEQPAPDAIPAQ